MLQLQSTTREDISYVQVIYEVHQPNRDAIYIRGAPSIIKIIKEIQVSGFVIGTNASFPDGTEFRAWRKLPVVFHIDIKGIEIAIMKFLCSGCVNTAVVGYGQNIIFAQVIKFVVLHVTPIMSYSEGKPHSIRKNIAGIYGVRQCIYIALTNNYRLKIIITVVKRCSIAPFLISGGLIKIMTYFCSFPNSYTS